MRKPFRTQLPSIPKPFKLNFSNLTAILADICITTECSLSKLNHMFPALTKELVIQSNSSRHSHLGQVALMARESV
jgi:hypothetical protein